MRWSLLILLFCGLCLSLAEKSANEKHHRHHRRHRLHHHMKEAENDLSPMFRHQDDICFKIKQGVTTAFTTQNEACGDVGQNISPDTILVAAGTAAIPTPNCELDECAVGDTNPCLSWYSVRSSENLDGDPFFIPADFVESSDCVSAAPSTPTTPTTPTTPGEPDLTVVAAPVEWAPKRLVAATDSDVGDELCYYSTHFATVTLRDGACGSTIATIPIDTKLVPLYEYEDASSTCTEMSAIPVSEQRANFDRAEARRRQQAESAGTTFVPNGFNKKQPFKYAWWTKVRYGDGDSAQEGWVSTDLVIKKRCDGADVRCTFTANTPQTCYRVTTTRKNIKDGFCGTTIPNVVAKQHDILVQSTMDDAERPTSCTGDWIHVSFGDTDGYTEKTGTNQFSCNGDGWLTRVGPFDVIKVDHSRSSDGVSLTGPQTTAPNKFLLHTIEGSWPSNGDYPSGTLDSLKYWPNFHLARNSTGKITIAQYFSVYSSSRALESLNNAGVVQVEIGARADNPFTEKDWAIALAVRELFRALSDYTGIPLCKDSRVTFTDVHAYGKTSANRLTESDFRDVHGIVGHQHCPANSHWDPGQIDATKLF